MAEKIKEEIDTIKPTAVEPSVESIAENVINEIIATAYKQTGYYKMVDIAKPIIAEALRNERDRK